MTEWPPAPRLRAAMRAAAGEVPVDDAAKQRTKLLLDEGHHAPLVDFDSEPGAVPRDRSTSMLAIAAAMAALLALSVVVGQRLTSQPNQLDAVDETEDRIVPNDREESGLVESTDTPGFDGTNLCETRTETPVPHDVLAGDETVEIGVWRQGPGATMDVSIIIVEAGVGWRAQADGGRLRLSDGVDAVFYLNASDADAPMLEAALNLTCGFASYLVTDSAGYGPTTEAICNDLRRDGFAGYTFADPGPPPAGCELAQPTLILTGQGQQVELGAWVNYQDCSGPEVRSDAEGNTITTYRTCGSTLVHVETAGDDVWSNEIDGMPPADFAVTVMSSPT